MRRLTYEVIEEKNSFGLGITSYGIACYAENEDEGTTAMVASIKDITFDKTAISSLVNQCNISQLSLIHLNEIIDDFLDT